MAQTSDPQSEEKKWFIGWAFRLRNPTLNYDWFGSPHEIMQLMAAAKNVPPFPGDHRMTEVRTSKVFKDSRSLNFRGGPNNLALIQLLDDLVKKRWADALSVLKGHPTLLSAGGELSPIPLGAMAACGQQEAVRFLVDNGADVNGAGSLGMTALHWSSTHGELETTRELLALGADRSAESWFLLKPQQLAFANRHAEIMKLTEVAGESPKVELTRILKAMKCMA